MTQTATKPMLSYLDDSKLKDAILEEMRWHKEQDMFLKGTYAEGSNGDFRGCAVGCTIHSINRKFGRKLSTSIHEHYETELGIPEAIAHLEDALFEALPDKEAMEWPVQFLEAVPVGADLSMVIPQFLYWLLSDENDGVIRFAPPDNKWGVKSAIEGVIALFKEWIETGVRPSRAARAAAAAAARAAAAAAAAAAARAAAGAAARDAAWAAARAAAAAAAGDAAWAAAGAAAWAAARDAAGAAARIRQAEKLLELLRATA